MREFKCLFSVAAMLTALALPGGADAQSAAAEALQRCTAIEDNAERLRCFDELTAAPEPIVAPAPEAIRPQSAIDQAAEVRALPEEARAAAPAPEPAPPAAEAVPAAPAAAAEDDRFGREQVTRDDDPDRLIAHIVGGFEGWSGDTLFELDNGQVWRQAEFGRMNYRGPENPEVTIKKGFFGSYRLTVEGTNRWIRVKRVK